MFLHIEPCKLDMLGRTRIKLYKIYLLYMIFTENPVLFLVTSLFRNYFQKQLGYKLLTGELLIDYMFRNNMNQFVKM